MAAGQTVLSWQSLRWWRSGRPIGQGLLFEISFKVAHRGVGCLHGRCGLWKEVWHCITYDGSAWWRALAGCRRSALGGSMALVWRG